MTHLLRGEGHTKITNTSVGTAGFNTVTLPSVAGQRTVITHISGSGDTAAVVTLETPSVVWRMRFAGAFTFAFSFHFGEFEVSPGQNAVVRISTATANSEINIAGVYVGL